MNLFRKFLLNFHLPGEENDDGLPYYLKQFEAIYRSGLMVLNVNAAHLRNYQITANLYHQLREFPQEILPLMDRVAFEVL